MPVLVLYLLFFTVQLFFNHDLSQKIFPSIELNRDGKKLSASYVKQTPVKDLFKQKVRLNKRYEPSVLPPVPILGMALTVSYAPILTLGIELCQFYPEVFLSACSLRGPPVVV